MPQATRAPTRRPAPARTPLTRPPLTRIPVEPFGSAEQAWFWTMAALRARHSGIRGSGAAVRRPCDPDDIIRCPDRLYRNRRVDLGHARVLRLWGERQTAPDLRRASEHLDAVLWHEAIERLSWPLRMKGIVL